MFQRNFCNKKSLKASSAFIGKLKATGAADGLAYVASFRIDSALWSIAESIGRARQGIAERRNLVGARYDRVDVSNRTAAGTQARNVRIHTIGALGELILADLMPASSEIAALVAHKPDNGVDAVYQGLSIDSKTTDVGATNIYINGAAHVKKKPTHYFVLHLVRDDIADAYVISSAAVEAWDFQAYRPAPCYATRAPLIDHDNLPEKQPEFTA